MPFARAGSRAARGWPASSPNVSMAMPAASAAAGLSQGRLRPWSGRAAASASPMKCRSATAASGIISGASKQQHVVPDIITVAKGMGNGHPLGAVITTKAIADSLEKEGYFFSSAGGSPVSSVVGMTVLDIMPTTSCRRTPAVGDHLKRRLDRTDGSVFPCRRRARHGPLSRRRIRPRPQTLAPATAETAAICDRLLSSASSCSRPAIT
jgi:hypothetical protein